MKRTLIVAIAALALVTTACGDSNDSNGKLSGAATPGGVTTVPPNSGAPGFKPGLYALSITQGFNASIRGNANVGWISSMSANGVNLAADLNITRTFGAQKVVGVLYQYDWNQQKGGVMQIGVRISNANNALLKPGPVSFRLYLAVKGQTYDNFKLVSDNATGTVAGYKVTDANAMTGAQSDTSSVLFGVTPTSATGQTFVATDGTTTKNLLFAKA